MDEVGQGFVKHPFNMSKNTRLSCGCTNYRTYSSKKLRNSIPGRKEKKNDIDSTSYRAPTSDRQVIVNAACSALHPPDSAGMLPVVLTAKSQDLSTKSHVFHNPRKTCRAFFQPSLFNTPQITTRKFLTLKM